MMHGYGRRSQAAAAVELAEDDVQDTMVHGLAYGGIFHVEEEEDERDRVVYEELDDSARKSKALQAASERRANAERKRKQTEQQLILERPKELFAQHVAFAGALSDEDEDDDDDASNPFASLLQAAPTKAKKRQEPSPAKVRRRAPSPPSPPAPSPPSPEPLRRSPSLRVTPPLHPVRPSRTSLPATTVVVPPRANRRNSAPTAGNSTRSLAPTFEAADARPARWMRNVPATSNNKRRQSASTATALAKQQAEAKRRKSLPATMSSLDSDRLPVGRRLSDVLQKATVLSQQRSDQTDSSSARRDQSFEYTEPPRETDDGIADTVHEMRDEPFQTQFFSPSKLRNGAAHNRRPRADAVLAKIRGSIGDAIRKATRKTNRDLTLLRSQGQTLLRHGEQDSAGEVHGRDFVVVRLGRVVSHPQMLSYEAVVEDSSQANSTSTAISVAPLRGLKLTVLFSAQDGTAFTQQLVRGVRVKVFAPFQILNECFVPGLRRKTRKFLVGTSLFEILSDSQSTQ